MPDAQGHDADGAFRGYTDERAESSGAVVVIEDVAHGDGMSESDYSDKLLGWATAPPRFGTKMDETIFNDLSVRLHEPYWLLHEGNCEHFVVFDEIRLWHADDPAKGYPLTLQITPPQLDICRACSKVPAVQAVVGDIRLGESPSLLCGPCWRMMGPGAEDVTTIPLPKHEHGWQLSV